MRRLLFPLIMLVTFFAEAQTNPPAFVQKVYDDIFKNLLATKQIEKPVLQYFPDNQDMVIDYLPANGGVEGKIRVGVNFVRVLRSFGADSSNALAFVLGHEMAHIFLEQSNIDRVGSGYADKEIRKKLKEVKDSAYTSIFERQADEQAIFYAHIGGYNVTRVAEKVLVRIYEQFKLKENLKGYPSLKERKEIVRFSLFKMDALFLRYELANLALVAGEYEHAGKIYTSILTEGFKSAEIYNNLGLCYLLKVIESDSLYQTYEWPLMIDSKTKLTASSTRDIYSADVTENLNAAIANFEAANRFSGYKWGYLNVSIAHLLMEISKEDQENEHLGDCKNFLEKVKNQNIPHYSTMKGIIAHYQGDLEGSKKEFIKNLETFPISKRNLDRLFYGIEKPSPQQNPLSALLSTPQNLMEIFFDRNNLVRDTTSKILNSFMNTPVDSKKVGDNEYYRFDDRVKKKKLFFAKYSSGFEGLTETQLISYCEKTFTTNLYRYYTFKDWVIRYDEKNIKTVYLIQ